MCHRCGPSATGSEWCGWACMKVNNRSQTLPGFDAADYLLRAQNWRILLEHCALLQTRVLSGTGSLKSVAHSYDILARASALRIIASSVLEVVSAGRRLQLRRLPQRVFTPGAGILLLRSVPPQQQEGLSCFGEDTGLHKNKCSTCNM